MATINMHMKFEIEIPKQTWLMLRKPCRLQTDGQTDKVNPVYPPPPTSLGGGIKSNQQGLCKYMDTKIYSEIAYTMLQKYTSRTAETYIKFAKLLIPITKH